MAKTPNEKRAEANRDEAREHLRAAIKALTGKEIDEAAALELIGKATAQLDANKALAGE